MSSFDNYEKIIDTLMYLGDGVSLDFVVTLAWKNKKDERQMYYSEFEYSAVQKYNDPKLRVKTIKRTIKSFLSFSIKKSGIRIQIPRSLRSAFEEILLKADKWYTTERPKVFSYDGKKMEILNNRQVKIPLPDGYGIMMEPIVLLSNGLYNMGCRLYLNDSSIFVDITVEQFKELLDIVTHIDYYTAAVAVLNSLPLDNDDREKLSVSMGDETTMKGKGLFRNNTNSRNFFDRKE